MIFDTGMWATEGSGYQYDFDQFIVEFSPGQDTTYQFVPTDDAGSENTKSGATKSSNGQFDNKNDYLPQLGLSHNDGTETTKWDAGTNYDGYKFSGSNGIVRSYQATGESTEITILVEGTTLYQANGYYEFSDPTNYQTIEGSGQSSVALNPVGLGLLQDYSIATADDAAKAVSSLTKEIEGIGVQMATLGANMSELEIAEERLSNHVYLSEAGINRLASDVLADESTQLAKEQIRLQSTQALLTQAFSLTENILNTLL
jgi:flagellin-like hook-associated protein FlgL